MRTRSTLFVAMCLSLRASPHRMSHSLGLPAGTVRTRPLMVGSTDNFSASEALTMARTALGNVPLPLCSSGFADEAADLIREVSGAGSFFDRHQMPELYAGVQRNATNFPVQYLGANVPQAWAAGTAFAFLQAILGFQPDAPHDKLYLDPCLPGWLPDLVVKDLRVGQRQFDLRFWREGRTSRWEVTKGDASNAAQRDFASGPLLSGHKDGVSRLAAVD